MVILLRPLLARISRPRYGVARSIRHAARPGRRRRGAPRRCDRGRHSIEPAVIRLHWSGPGPTSMTSGRSPTAATSPRPPWPRSTQQAILNSSPRSQPASDIENPSKVPHTAGLSLEEVPVMTEPITAASDAYRVQIRLPPLNVQRNETRL